MNAMMSQITSFTIVYSTVYSGADQTKHQSSAPLAFVRGIHRSPVTGEFPAQRASNAEHGYIDDVIMAKLPGRIWVDEISGCKRYGGQSKFHIRYSKHFMKRGN